ncbi:MAG: hypothetical protein KatS3mg111_1470 [Pirellulaceae bacterium]|nr:MAG: hypothetical protein KatS3mg111_1470 [Pirellulaceae bacterium]
MSRSVLLCLALVGLAVLVTDLIAQCPDTSPRDCGCPDAPPSSGCVGSTPEVCDADDASEGATGEFCCVFAGEGFGNQCVDGSETAVCYTTYACYFDDGSCQKMDPDPHEVFVKELTPCY